MTWTEDDMAAAEDALRDIRGEADTRARALIEAMIATGDTAETAEAAACDAAENASWGAVMDAVDGAAEAAGWTDSETAAMVAARAAADTNRPRTVAELITELHGCPLDARVMIGMPDGVRATRHYRVELKIVDDDGHQSETVVLWPRTEGT